MWRNWAVAGIPRAQFSMFPGASTEGKLATYLRFRGCLELHLTTSNFVNIPIVKIHTSLRLRLAGIKQKKCIVDNPQNDFFCFIPLSLGARQEF